MTVKKAVLPSASLPPVNAENKYAYRYRIVSEDKNRTSSWSPIKIIDAPEVVKLDTEIDGELLISGKNVTVTWSDQNNRPNYDVFVSFYFIAKKASLTNNVATIQTTIDHNLEKGDRIFVSGVGAAFNTAQGETQTITATTHDTISFAKTNADIPEFNLSIEGYVGMDYFYHGTTPIHTYSFVKRDGSRIAVAIQVEGISVDGTKPFYGAIPKTTMYPEGNALLVYTNDKAL